MDQTKKESLLIIMATSQESALKIAKLIVKALEDVFLGDKMDLLEKAGESKAPMSQPVIAEAYDGRVLLLRQGDLTKQNSLGRIDTPIFDGDGKGYIEAVSNGIFTDINHKSAQNQNTKEHLYFVQAMRLFMPKCKAWELSFNDNKSMSIEEVKKFSFFDGAQA